MGSQYRTWNKIDTHTSRVSHNPSDGKRWKSLTGQTRWRRDTDRVSLFGLCKLGLSLASGIPARLVWTPSCEMSQQDGPAAKAPSPDFDPQLNAEYRVIINVWIFFLQVGY